MFRGRRPRNSGAGQAGGFGEAQRNRPIENWRNGGARNIDRSRNGPNNNNNNNNNDGGTNWRTNQNSNNPRQGNGAYGGMRPRNSSSHGGDGRGFAERQHNTESCLPMSQHTLRKIIEERDPDQLLIALESKPGWRRLLSSDFSVEDLDAILSACAKCAKADGRDLLSAFVENVLASKGQDGGGQHFVTRAVNLLGNANSFVNSTLNPLVAGLRLSHLRSSRTNAAPISESTLLEKALQLVEVAVWVKPAALANPSKILLSIIETHPRIAQFKDSNAGELTTRIAKVKEELEATKNASVQSGKDGRNRGPSLLRGYRITGAAPDNFREMSILPTKADLDEETPFLRQNVTKGSYTSVEDYLDIQFRLLREDYVTPLRLGLQQFRGLGAEAEQYKLNSIQDVRFYTHIQFNKDLSEKMVVESGPRVVLQLDVQQLGRVNWERTKRLSNGSLIGASHNNFETIVFITVVNREPESLKRGIAYFELCQGEDAPYFKPGVEYSLIESSGAYFEAYRHNLAVLQTIESKNFPFAKHLVSVEKEVRPPSYMAFGKTLDISPILKNGSRQSITPSPSSPTYNFYDLESDRERSKVHIRGSRGWPVVEDTCLNPAQFKAVTSAFDKELCVIQGPPGTGKTFVGLKIVEMLLLSRVTTKPLLIVCYTNHALDQFLEGIVKCTKKIVRIGGRCQSETIECYNLRILRRFARPMEPDNADFVNYDEKNTRHLIARKRNCCEDLKENIQAAELFLNQLLGRATFKLVYRQFNKDFDDFIQLNEIVADFKRRAFVVEQEDFDEGEEDGYMSDEDHGELEEGEPGDATSVGTFNSAQEQAIFERLGSWQDRFNNYNHLQFAEFKMQQIAEFEAAKMAVPRELWLSIEERWLLYRQHHWREAMEEVLSYLARCATRREAQDIHVTQETLAALQGARWDSVTEDDQIALVIRCLRSRLPELRQELSQKVRELAELELALDYEVIRYRDVIGITTTGAAKYNRLLRRLGCEIIVIEEAAEILEAHLITTLNPQTKQLILIGDHQQLQPSTTVFALAKDFRMQVSLFERLLTNGLPYVRLQEQHRMRDEFLQLLVPTIYVDYFSHSSVFEYENVRGLTQNLCFITHSESEDSEGDTRSKSNTFEARFVTRLALHLRMQGYGPEEIVILTTYSGQVFAIRNEVRAINNEMGYTGMKNETRTEGRRKYTERVPIDHTKQVSPFEGVRVTTVDNYQGEESEVIIASFVRSNDDAKIGFLSRDNRVCVALSRAKKGFYCVGNLAMLAKASVTWQTISAKLLDRDCVKKGIELYCERHDRKLLATTPKEFAVFSFGGCDHPCETRLDCGHVCPMPCHKQDANHEAFECQKECKRPRLECDHPCVLRCFENCGECLERVVKHLPCKHEARAECFRDPKDILCLAMVDKLLLCGHLARERCCTPIEKIECDKPCQRFLGCEHPCKKKCFEKCPKCLEYVTAESPCGHKVRIVCRDRKTPIYLEMACEEKVTLPLKCGHTQKVDCHKRDQVDELSNACIKPKIVECTSKHKLKVSCKVADDDVDRRCTEESFVQLHCGHEMKTKCNAVAEAKNQLDSLTASCAELVTAKARCGHSVKVSCHQAKNESILITVCSHPVEETLDCGHTIRRKCNETKPCVEMVKIDKAPCGHQVRIRCCDKANKEALKQACHAKCDQLLLCEHRCTGTCQRCRQGSFHQDCQNRCGKVLFCGHRCPSICHGQCSPCQVAEPHQCLHSRSPVVCMASDRQFNLCDKKPYHPCTHSGHCDARTCSSCICRCDEICKKMISCRTQKGRKRGGKSQFSNKHDCVGLCGEPCPSLCRICDRDKLNQVLLAEGVQRNRARYIELPCKHIFEVRWLDQYMEEQIRAIHNAQQLVFPKCPNQSCHAQLRYVHRYNYILAPIRRNMKEVMTRVFGDFTANRASLEALFQGTLKSSRLSAPEIKNLLTMMSGMAEKKLSRNTIECLTKITEIIERDSAALPQDVVMRLIRTWDSRQLLSDVVRFLRSDNVGPVGLPHAPEQIDHWGACAENHCFSTRQHVGTSRFRRQEDHKKQFNLEQPTGTINEPHAVRVPQWSLGWRPGSTLPTKRPSNIRTSVTSTAAKRKLEYCPRCPPPVLDEEEPEKDELAQPEVEPQGDEEQEPQPQQRRQGPQVQPGQEDLVDPAELLAVQLDV